MICNANDFTNIISVIDKNIQGVQFEDISTKYKYINPDDVLQNRMITCIFDNNVLSIDIDVPNNSGVVRYVFDTEFWTYGTKFDRIDSPIKVTFTYKSLILLIQSQVYFTESKKSNGMFEIKYLNGDLIVGDKNGRNKHLVECLHGIYQERPDILPLTERDFNTSNLLCKITFPYSAMYIPFRIFLDEFTNPNAKIRFHISDTGIMYLDSDIPEPNACKSSSVAMKQTVKNLMTAYISYKITPDVWNVDNEYLSFNYKRDGIAWTVRHSNHSHFVVTLYIRNDGTACFKMCTGTYTIYSTVYSIQTRNEVITNVRALLKN